MIVIIAFLLGIGWGAYLARRRGGKGLDVLQYAAAFGIAFAIAGLFASVIVQRMF